MIDYCSFNCDIIVHLTRSLHHYVVLSRKSIVKRKVQIRRLPYFLTCRSRTFQNARFLFIRRRSYIENSFIQEIHYVYNIVFEPEIHTKPFKSFHYIVYHKRRLSPTGKKSKFGWWWWSLPVWCGQEHLKNLQQSKMTFKNPQNDSKQLAKLQNWI